MTRLGKPPRRVREVARHEVAALSRVLAQAFEKDPVHRWIYPGELEYRRHSAGTFATLLGYCRRHGTPLTTDGGEGAALWYGPDKPKPGRVAETLFGLRMARRFWRRAGLLQHGFRDIEAAHPKEPHWYLAVLGTDPTHQGGGVGGALLGPILRRCDTEQRLAWLEASRIENVPYYQRFGFHVVREIPLPAGPSVWAMRRDPR